jgi:probable F420-dependent oxidoreductase
MKLGRFDGAASIPADRRCLAALGPNMLGLASDRSLGPAPYFVPVEHTRSARERIGAGAWLAPELAFHLGPDSERQESRGYAAKYLALENYAGNLRRFGFGNEDLDGGGSDRLLDALVPQGDAAHIALVAHSHLEAGADHVALQPIWAAGIPGEQWSEVADALELRGEG